MGCGCAGPRLAVATEVQDMTPRIFCQPGTSELVKGAVHGTLGVLAGTCAVYNALAWGWRGDRRLLMNTVLYLGIVGLEAYQVRHHWWRAP